MNENSALLSLSLPSKNCRKDVSAAALSSEKTFASPADSITAEFGAAVKHEKSKKSCCEQAECT
jgi:hypothetical protein